MTSRWSWRVTPEWPAPDCQRRSAGGTREPTGVARVLAAGDAAEMFDQPARHGPRLSITDAAPIELDHGRDLGGGAAKQRFVGQVHVVPRDAAAVHREPEFARDRE